MQLFGNESAPIFKDTEELGDILGIYLYIMYHSPLSTKKLLLL